MIYVLRFQHSSFWFYEKTRIETTNEVIKHQNIHFIDLILYSNNLTNNRTSPLVFDNFPGVIPPELDGRSIPFGKSVSLSQIAHKNHAIVQTCSTYQWVQDTIHLRPHHKPSVPFGHPQRPLNPLDRLALFFRGPSLHS